MVGSSELFVLKFLLIANFLAGYSILGGTVPAADLQPYIDLAISQVSTLDNVSS